jgi:trans-2,3-dihydro-3-hydroxyanthranilate isomerase
MARSAKFILIDVFTTRPFGGNQLAVFTDASEISSVEMQVLARELNFAESTFVTTSDETGIARRVRIFTPKREIPMAGHPTVGTTWVLASRGYIALNSANVDATLRLGLGPITVSIASENKKPTFIWMAHRVPTFGGVRFDRETIATSLGITAADLREDLPIEIVSTGFPFLFVPIKSRTAIAKCAPNEIALGALYKPDEQRLPIFMFVVNDSVEFGARARMFAPHTDGIPEDPATGSAAAPFGAYAAKYRLIPETSEVRFIVDQGVEMGRPSQIHVEVKRNADGAIGLRIGGQCVIVGEGQIELD